MPKIELGFIQAVCSYGEFIVASQPPTGTLTAAHGFDGSHSKSLLGAEIEHITYCFSLLLQKVNKMKQKEGIKSGHKASLFLVETASPGKVSRRLSSSPWYKLLAHFYPTTPHLS
jgi:hypothetical protein